MTASPPNPRRRRLARVTAGLTAAALAGAGVTLAPTAQALDPADTVGTAASSGPDGDHVTARETYRRLTDEGKRGRDPIRVDLLAINDFHGNLEPIPASSSSGRINNTPAGGAVFLARHLKQLRAKARANGARPITVAAGDLIGASPLLSAAFHDEPTIEALNRMGLKVASVGNHEFDEGYRELRRLQRGRCLKDGDGRDNQDSCPDGRDFPGADFRYLAANVRWEDQASHGRETLFPATKIIEKRGVKVGFIGMTLEGTPQIVTKSGVEGLDFTDEVKTANSLVPALRERGVKTIVVLLHQGAFPADPSAYDACSGVSGPAVDIAKELSRRIDVVITGHTHQPYNCQVEDPGGKPRLLTSASSFGRLVTDVHLLVNPRSENVVREAAYAQNKIVTQDVRPVPAITRLIKTFRKLVAPIENEVIGHLKGSQQVSAGQNDAGESPLGDLIADAQLADESVVPPGGEQPDVAFMNPGGIRADLVTKEGSDAVTYGAAFSVQPFNNFLVSMDLTGRQIDTLLEQQFSGANAESNRVLQISKGSSYTWDASRPAGEKVDPSTVTIGGERLRLRRDYRVVVNSFLSDGGDGFAVLVDGADKYVGGLDIDALADYLAQHDPYTPTTGGERITRTP